MDPIEYFQELGVDLKNHASGSFYTKCPKCHDERKKQSAKEFLVNLDTGYFECFHCGWSRSDEYDKEKDARPDYKPKPQPLQKFITPEPVFNWIIPDAVIDPKPGKPLVPGKYHITWYYRNINDKLTAAKKMEYNFHENGFNRADKPPIHLYTRDSGYYPCLFYERDLYLFPYATVILLESEKTAAVLRKKFKDYLKEFIYVATGGSNSLTIDKTKVLANRTILICYDCDKGGREGSQAAHTKLAGIAKSFIVDIDPEKDDGTDLADIETDIEYIRSLKGEQKYPKELIEKIRTLNREGTYWNKERADTIGRDVLVDHSKVYEIGRVYFEANKHEFGLDKAPLLKKIEFFLLQRYEFRRNIINRKVYYRDKSHKDSEFVFCNYNDVWRLLQHNLQEFGNKVRVNITDVSNLLESDFVTEFNPFKEYFQSLPHWDGIDHITLLANHVTTTDQPFWISQFRKALIRMIACTYGGIENRIVMTLVQERQETGKSNYVSFLCPPQLREYYKEDPMIMNKDAELALAGNFIWNLDELAQLNKKEISELKGILSRRSVKQRKAYGRDEENYQRIVNFWGSTNKEEFLTDSQNTRWLCFRVTAISHDYNNYLTGVRKVDINKVWAQAWYLYKSGEPFTLDADEREKRDVINHSFEIMPQEKQLIIKFLTPCPKDAPGAEFVTTVEILEYLIAQTGNKLRLAPENVGRSMSQLDFELGSKKINGKTIRGYYALRQPLLNGAHYQYQKKEDDQPEIFSQSVPGIEDELPF